MTGALARRARRYARRVTILLETHASYLHHDTGPGHPERPARLEAVLQGIADAGVGDAIVSVSPRPATQSEIEGAHTPDFVAALRRFCLSGGGHLDPDTSAGPESWDAALLAAGAGLDAVERLERGEADAAFCAVRPPTSWSYPWRKPSRRPGCSSRPASTRTAPTRSPVWAWRRVTTPT